MDEEKKTMWGIRYEQYRREQLLFSVSSPEETPPLISCTGATTQDRALKRHLHSSAVQEPQHRTGKQHAWRRSCLFCIQTAQGSSRE